MGMKEGRLQFLIRCISLTSVSYAKECICGCLCVCEPVEVFGLSCLCVYCIAHIVWAVAASVVP